MKERQCACGNVCVIDHVRVIMCVCVNVSMSVCVVCIVIVCMCNNVCVFLKENVRKVMCV